VVKSNFRKLFIIKVIIGIFILSTPIQANAGVLSFVSNLFNKTNQVIEEKDINSQNMALLQATINSNPNPSKGGGEITIIENTALLSEMGPSGSLVDIKESSSSDQINIYVVREGDSLSQIAKMFNVSTNTIIWANDLHNSIIKEGQTLVILPITGIRHEVVKGETLVSVTKKYKGDLDEILNYNNLSQNSKLAVGDVVIIPDGDMGSYSFGATNKGSVVRESSGPSYGDYYIIPTNGRRSQGLHGYNAIDIAAPTGTPIVASASGQVIISRGSGWNGGYGSYVVIKHNNGTQTLYAHMNQNIVYSGQNVFQGQVIGYVGNTGKSTGPHIHFEIRGAKNPF
jgi:murein DD-endopeptidase MepM/ murein hydrolase activator NlpD